MPTGRVLRGGARPFTAWSRRESVASDRRGERDPHHIDDTNSGDVFAYTGAMTLDGSESLRTFGSTCNSESFTKSIIQKHA
jgi:hypothetical protein